MIYQDNCLLRSSRFRKTSHFQVFCYWGQQCITELSHCPLRSFGGFNLPVFGKCSRAVLEVPSFIFFLFFYSAWGLGMCSPFNIISSWLEQCFPSAAHDWVVLNRWQVLNSSSSAEAKVCGEEGSAWAQGCEGASPAPPTDGVWIGL